MKKILIFFLLLIAFASCEKDESNYQDIFLGQWQGTSEMYGSYPQTHGMGFKFKYDLNHNLVAETSAANHGSDSVTNLPTVLNGTTLQFHDYVYNGTILIKDYNVYIEKDTMYAYGSYTHYDIYKRILGTGLFVSKLVKI